MIRHLRCYAYGRGDAWEAICVDLDLAVTGHSLADVKARLSQAIESYVRDAIAESPEVARRLLYRSAPWYVRARHALGAKFYQLKRRAHVDNDVKTSGFDLPCHA